MFLLFGYLLKLWRRRHPSDAGDATTTEDDRS
jgi:hypothetical protein